MFNRAKRIVTIVKATSSSTPNSSQMTQSPTPQAPSQALIDALSSIMSGIREESHYPNINTRRQSLPSHIRDFCVYFGDNTRQNLNKDHAARYIKEHQLDQVVYVESLDMLEIVVAMGLVGYGPYIVLVPSVLSQTDFTNEINIVERQAHIVFDYRDHFDVVTDQSVIDTYNKMNKSNMNVMFLSPYTIFQYKGEQSLPPRFVDSVYFTNNISPSTLNDLLGEFFYSFRDPDVSFLCPLFTDSKNLSLILDTFIASRFYYLSRKEREIEWLYIPEQLVSEDVLRTTSTYNAMCKVLSCIFNDYKRNMKVILPQDSRVEVNQKLTQLGRELHISEFFDAYLAGTLTDEDLDKMFNSNEQ